MTPTFLSESLFLLRALLRLAREPTTTTSSSACESSSVKVRFEKKVILIMERKARYFDLNIYVS